MEKYEAIGKKMLIEPTQVVETTSGILRVDQGHSTPVRGKVIVSGKGTWRKLWLDGSRFKVGDIVLFRRYSVDELKVPQTDGSEKSIFVCEDPDVVLKVINS